ncbi:hypothetical protein B0T21DRAFT_413362 [Apiosordaria backusii]|uniref:Yeast cell wall synthesis Kre9/Knh1-like N-terminal domain-containing protein n=1 Tax=Apiosordaria backusii TaxID=314023 RepID=A0AA40E8Q3_9PEZI|nr:hypothetical protein B0T21DRAFT_413362 [Apiosordaria backusii]
MKFSAATVLALATAVVARPKFTNSNYDLVPGEPFTLKWDSAEGNVKIELFKGTAGDENSFKSVETLTTTTGASGSFTFTPTGTLNGDYAFRISDDSGDAPNFSPPFALEGSAPVSSTSASASASASVTSSAETSTETETESSTETSTETETSTAESTSTSATTLETTTTRVPTTTRRSQVTETAPPNTNNGQRFASSLALVLGTVAALVFFN